MCLIEHLYFLVGKSMLGTDKIRDLHTGGIYLDFIIVVTYREIYYKSSVIINIHVVDLDKSTGGEIAHKILGIFNEALILGDRYHV